MNFQAIIDYFETAADAAADPRRRSEKLIAALNLDDLQRVLAENYDMELKRSTLYTRLLPRNSLTAEGKRHHNCAPVRLRRPQNDLMKKHIDGHFASATIKYIKVF